MSQASRILDEDRTVPSLCGLPPPPGGMPARDKSTAEAEEELRFRNTILATQQEASLDGILVVDERGAIISHNRRFVEIWGIPQEILDEGRDELALDHVRDKLVDPEGFLARVRYLYEHPRESSSDEIHLRDGRILDRYSSAMVGPDGRLYGRVWFFRDTTRKHRAEAEIREGRERLEGILESAMDAIVTVDADMVVQLFNAAAEDVFRCAAGDVVGRPFDRFASPQFRRVLEGSMRAFRRRGTRKRYLWAPEGIAGVRADGEEFPVEATISCARVAGGDLFTIILRDVNDRARAEKELERLERENLYLREEIEAGERYEDIIARSPAFLEVLEKAEHVASTDTTVLVTGETGTGKGIVAAAVHRMSRRGGRMMVTVNCAALPAALIESELFGHEKGAFTGALSRKAGRFQLADGGTIFLDEVGDLPLELQAKLLRVLQDGEFERVGGTETIRVDARVIAATNHDLERAVAEGRFRADLFYRLNVFPLQIPPLRERQEDIPPLVRHFVLKYGAKTGKRIETVPKATLQALTAYPWPGNVRELQNVLERAVILSDGPLLRPGDWLPKPKTSAAGPTGALPLREMERRHILEVLEQTGWRVSGKNGAADVLGLKRTTLESRMKRLGITRPR